MLLCQNGVNDRIAVHVSTREYILSFAVAATGFQRSVAGFYGVKEPMNEGCTASGQFQSGRTHRAVPMPRLQRTLFQELAEKKTNFRLRF